MAGLVQPDAEWAEALGRHVELQLGSAAAAAVSAGEGWGGEEERRKAAAGGERSSSRVRVGVGEWVGGICVLLVLCPHPYVH